jgi:hypothetical protein
MFICHPLGPLPSEEFHCGYVDPGNGERTQIFDARKLTGLKIAALALYRVFLHPLAKYPGPLLGRITDWYSVYHAVLEDRHWDLYQLHIKYGKSELQYSPNRSPSHSFRTTDKLTPGPIVRYGPNRISVLSNTAMRDINATKSNTTKSDYYASFKHFFGGDALITTTDKPIHARKRRIISQALSLSNIKHMEEHILKNVRAFCKLLVEGEENSHLAPATKSSDEWSPSRNVGVIANWLTLDLLGDIVFNEGFQLLKANNHRWLIHTMPQGMKWINIVSLCDDHRERH